MPVLLVKAALMSSSAFFSEAAAKTVMALSCASAPVRGLAVAMTSARAVKNEDMRPSILALLYCAARPCGCAPSSGGIVCREAANPEAPFRDKRRAYGAPWAVAQE